jgi:hypothetical protein
MVEQLPVVWWIGLALLLGFGGGVLSGALGVGSGIIFIPVLVMVFLLPQKAAQGTALAVMVPMALLGAVRYWKNPAVELDLGLIALLAVGSLGGVLIGTEIAKHLPGFWLRRAFALLMVVVAARMFFMPPKPDGPSGEGLKRPPAKVTLGDPQFGDLEVMKGKNDA